jgi:Peptidase inhibitor I78 family
MTMTFRATVLAVLAASALAGCVVISVDEAEYSDLPRGGSATCDANAYQGLVGVAEADVDRRRLPQTFRMVCHDCQVTMDFNPNRLTIQLDANNRVSSLSCG